MEIRHCGFEPVTHVEFKIDLIVWKSKLETSMSIPPNLFKIDLIVWKYGIGCTFQIVDNRFKIDLIVWKCFNFQLTNFIVS